jgi:hypothetical protein
MSGGCTLAYVLLMHAWILDQRSGPPLDLAADVPDEAHVVVVGYVDPLLHGFDCCPGSYTSDKVRVKVKDECG